MTDRLIISLSKQEKKWLSALSKEKNKSMAEIVRTAIHALKQATEDSKTDDIILATSGVWKKSKTKEIFSEKIRSEWSR